MQLARVVGTAIATAKHPSMNGQKLLVVQPLLIDGRPDGDPLLAVDGRGAGVGETVMITSDGKGTREFVKSETSPVRYLVLGIKD